MTEVATRTCAACGEFIEQSFGISGEFCSRNCFRAGRSHCLACRKSLPQAKRGYKKDFCDPQCRSRWYYRDASINTDFLGEKQRTTCKVCGKPITQPRSGVKFYCSKSCANRYYHLAQHNLSLTEEWGGYAPETRKALREVQERLGIGAAKRLALAIDHEYTLRHVPKDRPPEYILYHCKTCGKAFRRRPYGNMDKEYCSGKCRPFRSKYGEGNASSKLIRVEVEEIRTLHTTQHLSARALAEMYGVSRGAISNILRGTTWQPEQGMAINWEKVSEIRHLYENEHLTQVAIAERYGVDNTTIHLIVNYKTWKPENDPRRKEHQA